ncbi:MAG: exosortase [Pyrinomonadaceae bacterium]
MSVISLRRFWKPLAIAAALAFLYAGVMMKLAHEWWTDANYSHGLLIPFIIGYILWTERARIFETPVFNNHISCGLPLAFEIMCGAVLILCALLMLWGGAAGAELFVQRASLILMLAGTILYFFGFRLLRFGLVPLVLLMLAIPIPAIIFNKIAFPLQLLASQCAVWAMQTIGIATLRQGNIIELMPFGAMQPKRLEVVEACSGIRSLMTLVTLAVIFAYFTRPQFEKTNTRRDFLFRYDFWRATLIVTSAVPIAIATNAFRVSVMGVLARYYGMQIADGFFHSFSGWVVYVVAALMLLGFGWLLDKIFNNKADSHGALIAHGNSTKTLAPQVAPANFSD